MKLAALAILLLTSCASRDWYADAPNWQRTLRDPLHWESGVWMEEKNEEWNK